MMMYVHSKPIYAPEKTARGKQVWQMPKRSVCVRLLYQNRSRHGPTTHARKGRPSKNSRKAARPDQTRRQTKCCAVRRHRLCLVENSSWSTVHNRSTHVSVRTEKTKPGKKTTLSGPIPKVFQPRLEEGYGTRKAGSTAQQHRSNDSGTSLRSRGC